MPALKFLSTARMVPFDYVCVEFLKKHPEGQRSSDRLDSDVESLSGVAVLVSGVRGAISLLLLLTDRTCAHSHYSRIFKAFADCQCERDPFGMYRLSEVNLRGYAESDDRIIIWNCHEQGHIRHALVC